MKKLFPLCFILMSGCMSVAQKAKQQADFNAQFDLLTPEQQHAMYYEAFKDAYGIGHPAPAPVVYQRPIVYAPTQTHTYCYPGGSGGFSCSTY